MKICCNISGSERKRLVHAITVRTDHQAKYRGAPSFAYEIGPITVGPDGTLEQEVRTSADAASLRRLLEELKEAGFVFDDTELVRFDQSSSAAETIPTSAADGLTIFLPWDGFTDTSLALLRKLVKGKAALIRKALGTDRLTIRADNATVSFPWWDTLPNPETVQAYASFLCALCAMAKRATRASDREKPVVNEKYAFRCFLLRLGFVGDESKAARKILLQNLTGSAAFKNGRRQEAA